jgi:hypothetical protein
MNIKTYDYKSNVGVQYWEQYLGRHLTKQEYFILKQAKSEKQFNDRIKNLYTIASSKGLYIPLLTNMYGNCIFESLQYYKLCENVDDMRIGLALLMTMFKNKKNFFPNQSDSLNELFSFNDIEFVFCQKTKQLYKYNFDAMCVDLATDSSWTRLNTQLIFMIMSLLLNLKFIILNDGHHSYNTEISTIENENTKTIYLGQIGELHYIPLDRMQEGTEYHCPKYDDSLNDFHMWARSMAISLGRVTYDDKSDKSGDNVIHRSLYEYSDNESDDNSDSCININIFTKIIENDDNVMVTF